MSFQSSIYFSINAKQTILYLFFIHQSSIYFSINAKQTIL